MPRTGRPSKFNPELAERLLMALRATGYVETACAYAGVSKDVYYRWLRAGARAVDKAKRLAPPGPAPLNYRALLPTKEAALAEFSDAATRAVAEIEVRIMAGLQTIGKKDWRALAWLAERRWPERYGRVRLEVTGVEGGPPIEQRVSVYLPSNGRER